MCFSSPSIAETWSSSIQFACIGVAPTRLFTPQANGIKNIHLCCRSYPICSSWHQWGCVRAIMQIGRKLHWINRIYHSSACCGVLLLIILFIYFVKYVTGEIKCHHHKASKLASIWVTWASKIFGVAWDFSNIELQLKCCAISFEREGQLLIL